MSKKIAPSPSRAYHHGNLREALVDSALALVESGEEPGLSLRTVATRAGVSPAAPYRHFEDRQALRTAVATVGFDRLLAALLKVRPSPKDGSRVAALGRAYLAFAAQNKGLYTLMFTENHLALRFDQALATSSTAAFMELENAVRSQLDHPRGDKHGGDPKLLATTLWASLHGVAMLAFERLIPAGGPPDEARARDVSSAVVQLLVKSLFPPAS